MRHSIQWIFLLLSILFIISLSRSVADLVKRGAIVERVKEEVARAEQENVTLKQQAERINDPFFVEKQARDKLNMARDGEVVAIIPPITQPPQETSEEQLVYWQEWLRTLRFY